MTMEDLEVMIKNEVEHPDFCRGFSNSEDAIDNYLEEEIIIYKSKVDNFNIDILRETAEEWCAC